MLYKPVTDVLEVTMGCNMRCKHCGSSCENALKDELSTEEALKLCDDLGEMSFKWIMLSGGEPTTRKDWDIIAGIGTLGVSLDGLNETHDFIRREGSYD